jgi:hypothetical protein
MATIAAIIGWTLVLVGVFLFSPVADLLPVDFQGLVADLFGRGNDRQYDKVVLGGDERGNAAAWFMLVSGAIIVLGSYFTRHIGNRR